MTAYKRMANEIYFCEKKKLNLLLLQSLEIFNFAIEKYAIKLAYF